MSRRRPNYVPEPREKEAIGGGTVIFKRGAHGRIHPTSWPFEHGNLPSAVAEATRLAESTGESFEVWSRVETVEPLPCDAAGGMPVEVSIDRLRMIAASQIGGDA